MPIYQYFCEKDGYIELERGMNDPEFKICPHCNGELERQFGLQNILWFTGGAYSKKNHKE